MEAAPRLALLNFAFKTSPEPVHFSQTLKQYITDGYQEDGESYRNELHQLEGLRATAAHPTADAAGLAALYRYFGQLRALQSRFPMGKGQPAAVQFTWKDIYANMTNTTADVKFEMACILYNIGAVHSHLGAAENRTDSEGLKSACTHYQKAAWAFQLVREQFSQLAGTDIAPELIKVKHQLCLAQAQECILEKSIADARKCTTIGAVALQVLHYYRNASTYLNNQHSSISAFEIMGSKSGMVLQRYIQFKAAYIGSITYLYHGMSAEEQQKMGERVAFYQLAVDKLEEARKLIKYIEPKELTQEAITFTHDVVEGKRKAAKNENEFIYHEDVPEKELLTMMKPASLVKEIPINFDDPEISGPDLFARLVPICAHEASSLYSEEKAKLLRRVVGAVEEKDQQLIEFMSSLQLELLDALDNEESIPDDVVERCAAMNADSAIISTLVESMNSLAEIIADVEHALADVKQLIQDESEQEKQFQSTMGARPPSIVQTELSREASKYGEAHARTGESNQVLHKAMTLHLANLKLLASPLEVLLEKIPSVAKIEGLDMETLAEMRKVTNAVHEMQKQRSQLVQQLREDVSNDDVTGQLLTRGSEHAEEIFKWELQKYEPKIKIIDLNLAAQENIINRLTTVYASYGESRRLLADVIRRREAFINALITSFDTRLELLAKAQKGLEFYKKLSNNVNQLLARLKSTCQVQREERATLLSKQQPKDNQPASTVRSAEQSIPSVPESTTPKLKDYLPYMKNRSGRNFASAQPEKLSSEQMYPESTYPTSARPAPLGSEATTDPTSTYMDGYPGLNQNTQNIYTPQYNYSDPNSYGVQSLPGYQQYSNVPQNKTFDYPEKSYTPDSNSSQGTNYTPSQFPSQLTNVSLYSPYYTGSQDVNTNVTNSQNSVSTEDPQGNINQNPGVYYMSQPGYPNQQNYNLNQQYPVAPTPPTTVSNYTIHSNPSTQSDLSANFSHMQISASATPGYTGDTSYSQTQFSAYYLQNMVPNVATYSSAAQPTLTNMTSSQNQVNYNTLNYPYSAINSVTAPTYPGQDLAGVTYDTSNSMQYKYGHNVEDTNYKINHALVQPTIQTSTPTSFSETSVIQPHSTQMISSNVINTNVFPPEENIISSAALANVTVIDQPIKSHVSGQALSCTNLMQQPYSQNNPGVCVNPNIGLYSQENLEQNQQAVSYPNNASNQQACNENNPGACVNPSIGSYSQESVEQNQQSVSYSNTSSNQSSQMISNYPQSFQNHPGYLFNPNTGNYEYNYSYETSNPVYPSANENVRLPTNAYTTAGNYETVQSPSVNAEQPTFPASSNSEENYYNQPYGYQSNVSANVSSPPVNEKEQTNTNYGADTNQSTYISSGKAQESISTFSGKDRPTSSTTPDKTDITPIKTEIKTEKSPEQSSIDLLTGLDFSVDQKPLTPEIKVPPVSVSVIRKPTIASIEKAIQKEQKSEEILERPAKMDLFSDPNLLNKFTQEVKNLQKFVDSLMNKMQNGFTVLDNKWKALHDAQAKENASRSKSAAMEYYERNVVSEVVPFDDSRLMLKVNPEVFINASYYKQLASWCIPLVVSSVPEQRERRAFWTAVLENKVACVVCLLSEMEVQGRCYWPTAIGQSLELDGELKVTLDEVNTTVHWTERRMTIRRKTSAHSLAHYQINVFPNKVVSGPLVMLVDRVLSVTYAGRLSNQLSAAWVHCEAGAGRSCLVSLLTMLVCQVRAGQTNLCEMLETGCLKLCRGRTNVLEDTKFLADAYRAALFFVQGVLCSGTTNFNGEAISVSSSASVPAPPVAAAPREKAPKFSKESFEEMRQTAGLKTGDMRDPLSFLDPLWSLKKK